MRLSHILAVVVVILFSNAIFAQKAETEKAISGCWKIAEFSLTPEPKNMDQIKKEALNGTICLEKGRFVSKRANGESAGEGTYSISEDGKSILQKMDGMPDDMDSPAGQIVKLTNEELIIQAAEATMRFVRFRQ